MRHPDRRRLVAGGLSGLALPALAACGERGQPPLALHNASFDATRELYRDVGAAFATIWRRGHGRELAIRQSHLASARQAEAVIGRPTADVVTLAAEPDIDRIAAAGLIRGDWRARLPNGASPCFSAIVFLVRKGNPKAIAGWNDLVKPGVAVITADPRSSGVGRYAYLAALASSGTGQLDVVRALFANVQALPASSRAALNAFARGAGDVLLTLESEALFSMTAHRGLFDMVRPDASILVEPPVALVDRTVDRKGTRGAAEAYLQYLFAPEGQALFAKHNFRPRDGAVMTAHAASFPAMQLVTVAEAFGGWARAEAEHFAPGGGFDRIYVPKPAPQPEPAAATP